MSRPIQVGDTAFVRLGDEETPYTVLAIDGDNIYIGQPGATAGSLIYYQNDDWRLLGAEGTPYTFRYESVEKEIPSPEMEFLSDPYLLIQILSRMSNEELKRTCQTNAYINSICQGNELWITKLQNEFGIEPLKENYDPRELYQGLILAPPR